MKRIKHMILSVFRSIQKNLVYIGVFIAGVFVLTSYVWFGTAGTWRTWPPSTNYYNMLADAFVKGQTFLDLEVPQELLALKNPYSVSQRKGMDYLWDASLYKGKYYIYYGPLPAVAIAGVKLIHPLDISDNLIVFIAAAGLFIFQILLITRIWRRFFRQFPGWTLQIGILLVGLIIPINWIIHRPEIYQAAIMSAQFFLMGGMYFIYRAFENDRIPPGWLAWASVFWVCAIASRTFVILPVTFLVFFILTSMLRTHGMKWSSTYTPILLAFGIPMISGAIGLGWYNFARFESVSNFGYDYQLTMYNAKQHKTDMFLDDYIPPNIYYYFLNYPNKIDSFPYLRAQSQGNPGALGIQPPRLYYTEKVTGAIYVLPFMVFAFMPLVMKFIQKIKNGKYDSNGSKKSLYWVVNALGGSTVVAGMALFLFAFSTMRYYADVTPMLIVLAIIGFWIGYQAIERGSFMQFAYAGFGILLAGISIIVPNLLAMHSSGRLMEYSPQVFTSLDAFIKSFLY